MKFVTKLSISLILLITVFASLPLFQSKTATEYLFEEMNKRYTIPRFSEIDRLKIRFRNHEQFFGEFVNEGEEDDLDLPNVVSYEVDVDPSDLNDSASQSDESESNSEDASEQEQPSLSNEEELLVDYLGNNGPLAINEDEYVQTSITDLLLDKYMQNTLLKSALIAKLSRTQESFAVV